RADVVLRPLLDLDLDDDALAAVRQLGDVERVAEDAGAVVPPVVVEGDEVLEVLVERLLVERLAAPEAPPPVLGRVLEPFAEGALAEDFVAGEAHVDDFEALALVHVEDEADAAVVADGALHVHLGPAKALLGEVPADDLLAPADVGDADGPAAQERQLIHQVVALAALDALDGVVAQARLFLDADEEEHPVAHDAVGHDLHVREEADAVELADGLSEGF